MVQISSASKEQWNDDFPVLCETCLGPNPYIRMMKKPNGSECKICTRPFTVFRWKPGSDARYKKTEICTICAKIKNVCQTCLLDLEFNLPVQVRDALVPQHEDNDIPQSEVSRIYFSEEAEKKLAQGELPYGKAPPSAAILKVARNAPYYRRNKPHVCSFWVRGTCTRGDECPYLHENPYTDPELAKQNIKDRYYGNNDPVAKKMLRRAAPENQRPGSSLAPPEDKSITTLYLGNIDERVRESDIRDHFYAYGEIKQIRHVPKQRCAFITYTTREAAELAADSLSTHNLVIRGCRVRIMWARPRVRLEDDEVVVATTSGSIASSSSSSSSNAGYSGVTASSTGGAGIDTIDFAATVLPPPPGSEPILYPSQQNQLGAPAKK